MTDPVRHRQMEELEQVNLGVEILSDARNELYLNMRFLDLSLSGLAYEADYGNPGMGTDGFTLFYRPEHLFGLYRGGRGRVNRAYLHVVLHCLFLHMDTRGKRDPKLWNLACDIAVESIIDGLYKRCVHISRTALRRETYLQLGQAVKVTNAESVYHWLEGLKGEGERLKRLAAEFHVDDHGLWDSPESKAKTEQRQKKWKDNREKLQTEMETFSQDPSEDTKSLLDQVRVENRERYDYRKFLEKFAVMREEMQVDPDSFDYVFYTYGLSLYGNMPLVEPLETKEARRIEEFVIVIDTSMSCSGELVRRFLEETCTVLCSAESYFKKVNIHILQCDDQVRSDSVITAREELEAYMETFDVIGNGGTDFRPAFDYVRELSAKGRFSNLKGLIYFTDGKGIYPVKMPPYETAFVFVEDQYEDESVPAWAMKVILTPEELVEGPERLDWFQEEEVDET